EWMEEQKSERGKFWRKRNLRARGTLGRNWTSGFALTLERFSQDISEEAKRAGFPEPARSRGKQLEALERVLARGNETNALLVGEEGVGKLELLRGLAGRSLLGETLPELRYLRVLELDLPSLLAQVPDPGAREGALDDIFGEVVKAGNVILVVNGLQQYVGDNEGRPGTVDLTGILTSYLRIPSFRFVGLTTYAGLHQRLEQYPAFLSLMGKIEVPELSEEDTLAMLLQRLPSFEVRYGIAVTYPALRSAVELAGQFIGEVPFPQKAISLLQEALTYAAQLKEPALLPSHVEKVISEKTEMPVGQLKQEEREKLLRLESLIHERLVDQEEAVSEIASSLRRARTQVSARKGPMGSFLFLGPTGVGKTEAAKTLASIYFGSESRMLRLDMSEFQSANDIPRLLGGRGEEGLLTTPVRENPFSLLLLDELEKAHSSVLNLFLQVLDEGHITDGLGRRVDFKNTIIIATSNAGYQIILEAIRTNKKFDTLRQEIFDHLFEKGIYRPEFLNRFTAVVIFKPLSPEDLLQIAGLMLAKVQKNLLKKGVEFVVTDALKEKIAELGYDPTFGARHMQRVIQEKVENALAQGFLEGKLERGTKVELNPEDFSLQVHS
ncbi:ATP-dependent Clp protease ATP-binding subunit, partial [Patescibacteria group bacterium]|nr:ATP-dependent Clp protease ATP-binding subunit [Patescibacteria group bacterium]